MYRCILVPLDGTPFGEQALPMAVAIARRSQAVLQLAHVHLPPIIPSGAETAALPPIWIEMSWDEKKRYLDGVADRLASTTTLKIETRVMEGAVAAALERHAIRCGAGLIVMSTHGHVGLSRLWHHGVADQLARDLPLPILLVRPPDDAVAALGEARDLDLSHILIALDGSGASERIIGHAVTLGSLFGARFTLARVVDPERVGASAAINPVANGVMSTPATAARQYLNAMAERLRSRGTDVTIELLTGPHAGNALLERIRAEGADVRVELVAIESPERGVVSRVWVRDTADELVEESPVPVLLFQVPRAEALSVRIDRGLVGSG